MQIKYDDIEFEATEEYINAVKTLMVAQLKMLGNIPELNSECWHFGTATLGDLSNSKYLQMQFCDKENMSWMELEGDVSVTINEPIKNRSIRKAYGIYKGNIYTGGGIDSDLYLDKEKAKILLLREVELENNTLKKEGHQELYEKVENEENSYSRKSDIIHIIAFTIHQ